MSHPGHRISASVLPRWTCARRLSSSRRSRPVRATFRDPSLTSGRPGFRGLVELVPSNCQVDAGDREVAENQIEQLVLRTRRRGQLLDEEGYLELGIGGVDRLYGYARGGCCHNQPIVQDGVLQDLGADRGGRPGVELDGYRHAVNPRR